MGGVTVGHAMTRNVVVVHPEDSLRSAASILLERNISGMPVVDPKGTVVGVLSEKDVARVVGEATGAKGVKGLLEAVLLNLEKQPPRAQQCEEALRSVDVRTAMSQDPIVVAPSAELDVAARIMVERRINRLPVVEGSRLVGILTRHDILAALQ